METKYPGWLFDVSDFSALPGKGVKCFIDGKQVLVSVCYIDAGSKCPMKEKLCNWWNSNKSYFIVFYVCLLKILHNLNRLATGSS